jgi:hypothetical protein
LGWISLKCSLSIATLSRCSKQRPRILEGRQRQPLITLCLNVVALFNKFPTRTRERERWKYSIQGAGPQPAKQSSSHYFATQEHNISLCNETYTMRYSKSVITAPSIRQTRTTMNQTNIKAALKLLLLCSIGSFINLMVSSSESINVMEQPFHQYCNIYI